MCCEKSLEVRLDEAMTNAPEVISALYRQALEAMDSDDGEFERLMQWIEFVTLGWELYFGVERREQYLPLISRYSLN